MEKTIYINKKPYTLRATAGALVRYKQQFGTDYSEDLKLAKNDEAKRLNTGYDLVWAMCKTADDKLPDPDVFAENFKTADEILDVINIACELFERSMRGIKSNDSGGSEMTAENLIATALRCKMSTYDLDNLSVSVLLNSIYEYCEMRYGKSSGKRRAVQSDFDNF